MCKYAHVSIPLTTAKAISPHKKLVIETSEQTMKITAKIISSPQKVFALSRLFFLCEEDIYEIKSSENKTTTVYGKNDTSTFEVVTSKEGLPVRITYEDSEIAGIFTVSEIEKRAEKSEG